MVNMHASTRVSRVNFSMGITGTLHKKSSVLGVRVHLSQFLSLK